MENFVLLIFKGVGWGIIHSLWLGAILYGALVLAFQFLGGHAKIKSLLATVTLSMLLGVFFLTFFYNVAMAGKGELMAFADNAIPSSPLADDNHSFSFYATVEHYFPLAAALYTVGVLFQLALVVSSFRKLHRIRTQGLLDVPESWIALLARITQQMGLRRPIVLQFSTLVDVPAVIGHFKPIVLVPMALFSGISPEQVEAVLIHELAHIKRSDYLINLVKIIAETLLFFNPFVWLIGRMLEVERENACDDMVVALTSSPIRYAQTLLWLEERRQVPNHRLAMQAVTKKKLLLHRIKRITTMRTNCLNAKHKLAILTLLLGCITSLAWVKPFVWNAEPAESPGSPMAAVDSVIFHATDSTKSMVFQAVASDTVRAGSKSNNTLVHNDSAIQLFESDAELPDTLKAKVNAARQQADSIKAYFDSSEWKKEQHKMTMEIRKQTDSIKAYFDSPEWKEEQRKITVEIKKQTDAIKDYFASAEWKAEQRKITETVRKQADSLTAYFSSPEWKETMERVKLDEVALRKLGEKARVQADSIRAHFKSGD